MLGSYNQPLTVYAVAESYDDAVKVQWINYYWYGGYVVSRNERTNSVFIPGATKAGNVLIVNPLTDGILTFSADAVSQNGDRGDREVRTLHLDTIPPVVGPIQITRPPDGTGEWYNKPLTARLRVADLLSGPQEGGWFKANGEIVSSQYPALSQTN